MPTLMALTRQALANLRNYSGVAAVGRDARALDPPTPARPPGDLHECTHAGLMPWDFHYLATASSAGL
eukprot:11170001-Lingulodinium_polyedra.AAC.1